MAIQTIHDEPETATVSSPTPVKIFRGLILASIITIVYFFAIPERSKYRDIIEEEANGNAILASELDKQSNYIGDDRTSLSSTFHGPAIGAKSFERFTGSIRCKDGGLASSWQVHPAPWHHENIDLRIKPNKIIVFPIPKAIYSSNRNATQSHTVLLDANVSISYDIVYQVGATFDRSVVETFLHRFCGRIAKSYNIQLNKKKSNNEGYRVVKASTKPVTIHTIHIMVAHDLNVYSKSIQAHQQTRQRIFPLNRLFENTSSSFFFEVNQKSEEYMIDIGDSSSESPSTGQIHIYSLSIKGVTPALTTLSQLLDSQSQPIVSNIHLPLVIHDWPTHQWRGLLVDVARHFLPVKLLKRAINNMEVSKFNKLHLHISDAQSFPLLLDDAIDPSTGETLPLSQLVLKGSFDVDAASRPRKMYTKADIQELVEYARERGIEIVPEIDMPAHTYSLGKAFPEIVAHCPKTVARAAQFGNNVVALNPGNSKTLQVVSAILAQLADLFPSPFIHIGADEVHLECWDEDPLIHNQAMSEGLSMNQLWIAFETKVVDLVRRHGKTPLIWEDFFELSSQQALSAASKKEMQDIANVSIIQPWKCWQNGGGGGTFHAVRSAQLASARSQPVIMSACWYLDWEDDWGQFLSTDLIALASATIHTTPSIRDSLNPKNRSNIADARTSLFTLYNISKGYQKDHLIGGEGCLWTESIDHSNFECRLWPRAGAIAARLWGYERDHPLTLSFSSDHTSLIHETDELHSLVRHDNKYHQHPHLQHRNRRTRLLRMDLDQVNPADSSGHTRTVTVTAPAAAAAAMDHVIYEQLRKNSLSRMETIDEYSFKHSRQLMRNIPLNLDTATTRYLYASYVRYRFYLATIEESFPAHITIQVVDISDSSSKSKSRSRSILELGKIPLKPIVKRNESSLLSMVAHIEFEMASDSPDVKGALESVAQPLKASLKHSTWFSMTSRCLGIPEAIQRPIHMERVSAAYFRFPGDKDDISIITKWLRKMANAGVLFLGYSYPITNPHAGSKQGQPTREETAAQGGFARSHDITRRIASNQQFATSNSQFDQIGVGILSTLPFEIIGEYGLPWFQHGLLHVAYPALNVHVMIVHFDAHNITNRKKEASKVASLGKEVMKHNRLVIMGDMNTPSEWDSSEHDKSPAGLLFSKNNGNRRQKSDTSKSDDEIFEPMNIMLSRAGLRDACVETCRLAIIDQWRNASEAAAKKNLESIVRNIHLLYDLGFPKPSIQQPQQQQLHVEAFSRCIARQCSLPSSQSTNSSSSGSSSSNSILKINGVEDVRTSFVLLSDDILGEIEQGRYMDTNDISCATINRTSTYYSNDVTASIGLMSSGYSSSSFMETSWLYRKSADSEEGNSSSSSTSDRDVRRSFKYSDLQIIVDPASGDYRCPVWQQRFNNNSSFFDLF